MRFAVIAYTQVVEQAAPTSADRAAFSGGESSQMMMLPPGGLLAGASAAAERTTTALNKLERHLDWYVQAGLVPVTLDEVADRKLDPKMDPTSSVKRVALTFDGGYESHRRLVLPLLEKYKFRATFFVPRDMIDRPGGLSRGELEVMAKWGMGIGVLVPSQEAVLGMLPPAVELELSAPRRQLEEIIGRPVQACASPSRKVDGPFLRTLSVHGYRAVAIPEVGNHVFRDGMHVIARYFHRRNVKIDEWKEVARLSTTGPGKNLFYLRSS